MKKRCVCIFVGMMAWMFVGCGLDVSQIVNVEGTKEEVKEEPTRQLTEAPTEITESDESEAFAIGAGPDYVVATRKDAVFYWDEDAEEMETAQTAQASELVILSPGYEKLKAAIESYNVELKEDMEVAISSARDFLEDEEDLSFAFFPWDSTANMYVTRSDAQLFSYVINYYDYMGGAHGLYYSRGHNFEPETGTELKLTDLVTDLSALHELVVAQIKDEWDEGELFDEWEDTVAAEFDDPDALNFIAGPDTISIWFDVYDLAPYASGEIQTIFAMEDCEGLFNEIYFHAEDAAVEPGRAVPGTDLFQNVIQSFSEQIGVMDYNEVKAFLEQADCVYEEEIPGFESDGMIRLMDSANGADVYIFFWPKEVEDDEDYDNPEKYFIDSVRYELDEEVSGWIGRSYEGFTEYAVIDAHNEELYFNTVEEMTCYLFY